MRRFLTILTTLEAFCAVVYCQQIDSVVIYSLYDTVTYMPELQVVMTSPDSILPNQVGDLQLQLVRDEQQRPKELMVYEDSVLQERYRWFYDGQQLLVVSCQNRKQDEWRNKARTEFRYDTQGRLTEEIYSEWNNVYWSPVGMWRNSYEGRQYAAVNYMEPLFHDWQSMVSMTYDFTGVVGIVKHQPTYWNYAYGEVRDGYMPLLCNGHSQSFYGHRMDVYYVPDQTSLNQVTTTSRLPNGVYDLMGRRVAERLDGNLPHGIYLQVTASGARKILK